MSAQRGGFMAGNKGSLVGKAKIAQLGGRVAPVFLDLDPRLQVHLRAHEALDILPRELADLFEHGAALADDDALVALFFAVNGHVHVDDAVIALGKLRDLDGRAVRDLLIEAQQQLLRHCKQEYV